MRISFLLTVLLVSTITFGQDPWINEIHYNNDGGDVDEGVEIMAFSGTNLGCYDLVLYNGNGELEYQTNELLGLVNIDCVEPFWFSLSNMQNGSSDGIALVYDPSNSTCLTGGVETVIQFLSYDGT